MVLDEFIRFESNTGEGDVGDIHQYGEPKPMNLDTDWILIMVPHYT